MAPGSRGGAFLPLWLLVALDIPGLWLHHPVSASVLTVASALLLVRTLVTGFKACLEKAGDRIPRPLTLGHLQRPAPFSELAHIHRSWGAGLCWGAAIQLTWICTISLEAAADPLFSPYPSTGEAGSDQAELARPC